MTRWIGELEGQAQQRLSPGVYEYFRGGAGQEISLAEATPAWDAVRFRPRILRDVDSVDTSVTVLGSTLRTPVMVAPMALQSECDEEAEAATARGVTKSGSLLCVSCRSSVSYPRIAETGVPWWAQVYVLDDRGLTLELLDRAREAGAGAIVLTVDTPLLGDRRIRTDEQLRATRDLGPHYGGIPSPSLDIGNAKDLTFTDIARVAEDARLPVLVKGVLRGDDARQAVDAGAAGVIVSTHGARQLDPVIASAAALPDVAEALGGTDAAIIVDGGIRRGTHVMAALAMGATAVFVGRPVLWALTVGGADMVNRLIDDLTAELVLAMTLAGAPTIADLSPDLLAGRKQYYARRTS
ncbi:MAG TPA: alpha-hydroxy acid oxidase [Pseudonocardiaceae bacterium]|nr:alpha-hydroxy acid oxidase [Pseudonocardiaceae bacterium]